MGSRISAILLSYNRPQYLGRALESLRAQNIDDLEILVVDNESAQSAEIARVVQEFGSARLIAPGKNLGFTGGMNLGLSEASGDYVHLTEDDLVLESQCLVRLRDELETHPEAGLVTGMLLHEDGRTILAAGGELVLGARYRKTLHGAGSRDLAQFGASFAVTYLSGSMLFARRDFLRELGGFREDFFLYFEDDEISLRARAKGRTIRVVPAARARHFEPASGPLSDTVRFHQLKNLIRLYLLHAPRAVLPAFFLRYGALDLARRAVKRDALGLALRAWAWNFWRGWR